MLLPLCGNMEGSVNKESWQDVDGSSDCIQAVSDDGGPETEVALTDPEPMGEGDAIHVQCVQTIYEPYYWVNTIWG